jgi:Na+/H+ antiporter NhaD/arsenite permease-like protein
MDMSILTILASLVASAAVSALFFTVAGSRHRVQQHSRSELADTALALFFLCIFVASIGWLAYSVMPFFGSVPLGLAVVVGLYAATVAATYHLMRILERRGARGDPATGTDVAQSAAQSVRLPS